MTFLKRVFGKKEDSSEEEKAEDILSKDNDQYQEEDVVYPVVEREILPQKIICPDCGGITLEGLDFCDKCGGEL